MSLAKLIKTAIILETPNEEFIKIEHIKVFYFIWNNTDKIKLNTITGHIKDGGLAITDIEYKNQSFERCVHIYTIK